jgi:hypothetical protein
MIIYFSTKSNIEVIGAIGDGHTSGDFANDINEDNYGFSFVTGSVFTELRSQISLASKCVLHSIHSQ